VSWGWQWILLILVVGLADLAVRFATNFNMDWVVRAEAVLFLGASVALWVLHHRKPAPVRWQLRVQQILVAAFALAGLRATLWAGGLQIATANLIVLVIGALLVTWALVRARRRSAGA
jgi:hypothetical protein